jgi:hypothetical protein
VAYDLLRRGTSGKDWSCGIGDESTPRGAIAAGAAVVGLCVVGLFVASSLGGRRASSGPPTMFSLPSPSGRYMNRPVGR